MKCRRSLLDRENVLAQTLQLGRGLFLVWPFACVGLLGSNLAKCPALCPLLSVPLTPCVLCLRFSRGSELDLIDSLIFDESPVRDFSDCPSFTLSDLPQLLLPSPVAKPEFPLAFFDSVTLIDPLEFLFTAAGIYRALFIAILISSLCISRAISGLTYLPRANSPTCFAQRSSALRLN